MILLLLVLIKLVSGAEGAFCTGSPSPNASQNLLPVDQQPPVFVRSVPNASLYHVGSGDDRISIVHLYSDDAYAKGVAQGALMKDDVNAFVDRAFDYFEETFRQAINGSVPWIPPAIAEWIAKVGLEVALDLTYDATKPFTGDYFFEELRHSGQLGRRLQKAAQSAHDRES